MRWVVLTDDHPPADGGVATWAAAAADALGAEVFARARPGLVGAAGTRGPSFARWGALWVLQHAATWRADAVLATTWRMAWAVAPICRARGVPLHVVFHGSDARDRHARDTPGIRWAVSRDLAARIPGARWLPLPIGVRPPAAVAPEPWLFVGRAVRGKGGERVLRIAAVAGARVEIVGDGPELRRWRALAERIGADAVFHGRLDRAGVDRILARGGVAFLLPEARADGSGEGLGLALLEAAARGVPAVGCRTGGVPEAVGPGLLLGDPDDARGSAAAVRAWWRPERGAEARAHLARTHGPARFRHALEADNPPAA